MIVAKAWIECTATIYLVFHKMASSFWGFSHGRNSGQRGRVNNMDPKFAMTPKQYIRAVAQGSMLPSILKRGFPNQAPKLYGSKGKEEEERMDIEPHLTKTQMVESNRLKRKSDAFVNQYQDVFENKKRKIEIKRLAKDIAKQEREIERLQKEKEKQDLLKSQQEDKNSKALVPRPAQPRAPRLPNPPPPKPVEQQQQQHQQHQQQQQQENKN